MKKLNFNYIKKDNDLYNNNLNYIKITKKWVITINRYIFCFNLTKDVFNFNELDLDLIPESGLYISIDNFIYITNYKKSKLIKEDNGIILKTYHPTKDKTREVYLINKPETFVDIKKYILDSYTIDDNNPLLINPTILKAVKDSLYNIEEIAIFSMKGIYNIAVDATQQSENFAIFSKLLYSSIELPDVIKNKDLKNQL